MAKKYPIGDFSFLADKEWRIMCQDMFDAVTAADMWAEVAAGPGDGGFMFSRAPFISKISAQMKYDGHSGSSFGITMRNMQAIAINGWDTWAAEQQANQEKKRQEELATACFAAVGMDPHAKCPHGMPGYACMPCSH
jgi:hypothetical protein